MDRGNGYVASTHPQSKANWISFLLFWWTNDLFKTGNQRPLQQSDFWPLHEEDETCELIRQLQSQWLGDLKECRKKGKEPRLWRSAMKVLSLKDLCIIGFAGFFDSVGRFLQPIFLGVFISTLMSDTPERTLLSCCAVLIILVVVMKSVAAHHSSFKLYVIGMRMKASLKGLVFEKVSSPCHYVILKFTQLSFYPVVVNVNEIIVIGVKKFKTNSHKN